DEGRFARERRSRNAEAGREGLLKESLSALAEDSQASMLEIASAIGVGRTTLYRHFGDRETLVAEVARLGARRFGRAVLDARPESGTGLEAVERMCERLFTLPEVLTLMFADDPIVTDDAFAEAAADGSDDDVLERVIARGQADGSITKEVPVTWAAMYVFLTIGSGHLFGVSRDSAEPERRRRALELTIRAVRKALAADSAAHATEGAAAG